MSESKIIAPLINKVISELLQPTPVKNSELKSFKTISHEEILHAYKYWLEKLRLLIPELFLVEILQGLKDEGVDIVIKFLESDFKIGLQIKSYGDIEDKQFAKNIKAQITDSHQHGISKLIIIPCADLERKIQSERVRNLMSLVDQMDDDYCVIIQPQYALPICNCFKKENHPMSYLIKTKAVSELLRELSSALSSDVYDAKVSVNYNNKKINEKDFNTKISVKFRPFYDSKPENPIDKFVRLTKLGEPIFLGKQDVQEITIMYSDGRVEKTNPDTFQMFKEKTRKGPLDFCPKDDPDNCIKNVYLDIERSGEKSVMMKSPREMQPWNFELILDDNKIQFKTSLTLSMCDFKQFAVFQRFLMKLHEKKSLEIIDKKENLKFELDMDVETLPKFSEKSLKDIETIEFIQDSLSQRIEFSMDSALFNMALINELSQFIKDRKIQKIPVPFSTTVNKQKALELLEIFEKNKKIEKYTLTGEPMMVEMIGKNFEVGDVKIHMSDVIIKDNLDELKLKISKMNEEDEIDISIESSPQIKDLYELIKLPLEK